MKNLLTVLLCFLVSVGMLSAQIAPRKIQLVILFDTSNSMDGLIEQAKSKIWAIVNETTGLRYQGVVPTLEIAVYDYGNSGLSAQSNYIRQQTPFTTNLDVISEKLFALRTNGGDEFCGAVIKKSLDDLTWSADPKDLKMIYIAGNEPFTQGPIDYKEACKLAVSKGVFINTIYCGVYDQGVRESWKDGATCSKGDYFNINSNEKIAYYSTPYDSLIQQKNTKLNGTYVAYGSAAVYNFTNQAAQDNNAKMQSAAVSTERIIVKSKKSAYKNEDWDAVDAYNADSTFLDKAKDEDLPKEMKGKTKEEKEKIILEKNAERDKIQQEIGELAKKREEYINELKKKEASNANQKKDDFGTAVSNGIHEKAKAIGFE